VQTPPVNVCVPPAVTDAVLIAHAASKYEPLKLPLLCARANPDPKVAIRIVTAITDMKTSHRFILQVSVISCLFAVILVDLTAGIGHN